MNRCQRGFTLVELLVVITIIGILMALLIPGVNSLREKGRQTQCLNNEKELAQAVLHYELSKRKLPGIINVTAGVVTPGSNTPPIGAVYTWFEALFPFLDRNDAWATIEKYNSANPATCTALANLQSTRDKLAVCPNDPNMVDPASTNAQALLSYGVNDNFFVSYVSPSSSGTPSPVKQGYDRNSNMVTPASSSKLVGRPCTGFPHGQTCSGSTTIMIGERTGDGSSASFSPTTTPPGYPRVTGSTPNAAAVSNAALGIYAQSLHWVDPTWSPTTPASLSGPWYSLDWYDLAFQWPTASTTPAAPAAISPYMMTSTHPGVVIVVFFDGGGQVVSNDALYPQ